MTKKDPEKPPGPSKIAPEHKQKRLFGLEMVIAVVCPQCRSGVQRKGGRHKNADADVGNNEFTVACKAIALHNLKEQL